MTSRPSGEALTLSQLPLFPLQTVLFPGGWMSLRIFEVRYLDMISRCHKAGAPFGIVALSEGSEVRRIDPNGPPHGDAFAKEVFHSVGTMVQIEHLEKPQPGLMLIRCRGLQRFHITRRQQLPHGLWVGDVRLDDRETVVPVPEHLVGARDALQRLLKNLEQRDPQQLQDLPIQQPFQWDDSGWLANRWAELLPAPTELKQRLMSLENPLVRLELVADMLDKLGLDS